MNLTTRMKPGLKADKPAKTRGRQLARVFFFQPGSPRWDPDTEGKIGLRAMTMSSKHTPRKVGTQQLQRPQSSWGVRALPKCTSAVDGGEGEGLLLHSPCPCDISLHSQLLQLLIMMWFVCFLRGSSMALWMTMSPIVSGIYRNNMLRKSRIIL